jgi:hypothetical protein
VFARVQYRPRVGGVWFAPRQGIAVNAFLNVSGEEPMPAYIHQHDDFEPPFMICPSCVGLPMHVRDVEPHWSMAKIDFTFECADCGAEVRETIAKPEARH